MNIVERSKEGNLQPRKVKILLKCYSILSIIIEFSPNWIMGGGW